MNGFLISTVLPGLTDTLTAFFDTFGIEVAEARRTGIKLLIIWFLAFLANRVVRLLANRIAAAADDRNDLVRSSQEKRAATISGVVVGVGNGVILTFAAILSLGLFVDIGPVLAGAGVIGLAVSFGSQSLVKDMISGFFLLVENQFALGDTVDVAGLTGEVEQVSLRTTQVRDLEGILHVIPNGQITIVGNRSRDWSRRVLDIGVGYDADIDRAIELLREVADGMASDPEWQAKFDGPPSVEGVNALGDSAVVLRVMLRTEPGAHWAAGREYLRRVKLRLDQAGIDMPFPQRVVHLAKLAPVPEGDAQNGTAE